MTTLKGDPDLSGWREFLVDGVPERRQYFFVRDPNSPGMLIEPELCEGERLVRCISGFIPEIITEWKP